MISKYQAAMSLSFFSPSFSKTPHSNEIRSPPNSSSRKRKRSRRDPDDFLDGQSSELYSSSGSTESPDGILASPHLLRVQQLETQQLGAQHRANEQSWNIGILGMNFPPVKPSRNEDSLADVKTGLQDALVCANPCLLFQNRRNARDVLVHDVSRNMGFRQQHLAALTAVLHRCILAGDYTRAGRAWGILLRTEVNGHFMDVRTHDRWGFGAEILCRRHLQPIESTSRQQRSLTFEEDSKKQPLLESNQWFSSEGFDKARGYYERLILQHPYRKAFPSALSALDFYPAMFGLWIYSEQEEHELSLKSLREADINLAHSLRKPEHTSKRGPSPRPHAQAHLQEEDINKAFLRRGRQIAARLDELLVSPPFSDSTRLRDLQSMVNRWIEDFSITTLPTGYTHLSPSRRPIANKQIPTRSVEEPR